MLLDEISLPLAELRLPPVVPQANAGWRHRAPPFNAVAQVLLVLRVLATEQLYLKRSISSPSHAQR